MNEPINDGGTVIETSGGKMDVKLWSLDSDISLRDWFAGQATDADIDDIIKQMNYEQRQQFSRMDIFRPLRQWARYVHADEMLKAREQK